MTVFSRCHETKTKQYSKSKHSGGPSTFWQVYLLLQSFTASTWHLCLRGCHLFQQKTRHVRFPQVHSKFAAERSDMTFLYRSALYPEPCPAHGFFFLPKWENLMYLYHGCMLITLASALRKSQWHTKSINCDANDVSIHTDSTLRF